jgi:ubiquinone/menaquinone biosynthesis C-methylase UbiE
MTEQAERYDRVAAGYARWWAPVLAPAVETLLDRSGSLVADGASRLIDIGTGTGQLALGALARWPGVSVVAVDASAGMRAMADANAAERLAARDRARYRSAVAFADAMPFPDGAFDLALSSFVFQLVPNRARALREARRVLRPGGSLAYVSWLADDRAFQPDVVFDDVLDDLGIGARDADVPSGDLPSVERAARELRRAGFAGVVAESGRLEHRFTVDGYIAFLTEFDEDTLFDELDPELRGRLLSELRTRLSRLRTDQLTMRFPIVYAVGRRSRG